MGIKGDHSQLIINNTTFLAFPGQTQLQSALFQDQLCIHCLPSKSLFFPILDIFNTFPSQFQFPGQWQILWIGGRPMSVL